MTYEETIHYLKEDLHERLESHWKHETDGQDGAVGEWLVAHSFVDEDGCGDEDAAEAAGWELGVIKDELESTDADYAASRNMTAACIALQE